eukprot:6932558-Alexandrium_andersonii.AAC.1
MSASLVGSEMCIRDSPGPQHPTGTRPISLDDQSAVSVRTRGVGPARPVSYTHLTLPTICSV